MISPMETNKVKIKSDGSIDKLKCRIVVSSDLQDTAWRIPGHLQHLLGPSKCS